MQRLFEYAAFLTVKEDADGQVTDPARILIEPTTIIAESEEQVRVIASREIPDEVMPVLERVTLVVRPF